MDGSQENHDPPGHDPDDSDEDPRPPSPTDNPFAIPPSAIEDIENANKFIKALENAAVDDFLDADTVERLRNPLHEIPVLDSDERLAIDLFLSISNASVQTYNSVRDALLRRYP
ncbi:hypothetical protein R3P38DRAFT_2544832, partial [Favolaschia claudopus]